MRIRSPYIADIQLDDGTTALCHTPGMSCSGLVAPGKRIYVSENMDETIKTDWIVQTSDTMIGIHPLIAKEATYGILHKIHPDAHWVADVTIQSSCIDYVGYLPDGKQIYVEIKSVLTSPTNRIIRPTCTTAKERTETNVLKFFLGHPNTHSCHFLFLVPHTTCDSVLIDVKDDTYSSKMRQATEKGIHLHAFVLDYAHDGDISFQKEVPVHQV
jgi:DNA-binding sugar fermentation-stimulating protein